jgi:hypothetical protein
MLKMLAGPTYDRLVRLVSNLVRMGGAKKAAFKIRARFLSDPRALHSLGIMLLNAGHLQEAETALCRVRQKLGGETVDTALAPAQRKFRHKATDEIKFDVHYASGIIASQRGQLHEAERFYKKAVSINGDVSAANYALGSVKAVLGKLPAASKLFATDIPVLTGTGAYTYTRALCFDPNECTPESLGRLNGTFSRSITWLTPASSGEPSLRAMYFVAADSVYFCRYSEALINSIRMNAGADVAIHCHIVNPTEKAQKLVDEIEANATGVSLSCEQADLARLDDTQRKTYYSCSRYLILPEVLRQHQCPAIVADIDQMVMAGIGPLLELGEEADVALLRLPWQVNNLFSFLSATLVLVKPGAGGQRFADRLCWNVASALTDGARLLWHLDQGALAITHLANPDIRCNFIPPGMVHLADSEPSMKRNADEGIFWSITNSLEQNIAKLNTRSFRLLELQK